MKVILLQFYILEMGKLFWVCHRLKVAFSYFFNVFLHIFLNVFPLCGVFHAINIATVEQTRQLKTVRVRVQTNDDSNCRNVR